MRASDISICYIRRQTNGARVLPPRQPRRLPAAQCVSDCNKLQGTLVSGKVRNTFTEHA